MPRDWIIDGECLVKVKGGLHQSGFPIALRSELGLAQEEIRVVPRFRYQGLPCDDFGKEVFPEHLWMLATADIHMTLIHWDPAVVEACFMEAMGGALSTATTLWPPGIPFAPIAGSPTILNSPTSQSPDTNNLTLGGNPSVGPVRQAQFGPVGAGMAGTFGAGGRPMGGGLPMFASGNHYVSVSVYSPNLGIPYRFLSCMLRPSDCGELNKGTKASTLKLVWQAVPYFPINDLFWSTIGPSPNSTTNLSGTPFDPMVSPNPIRIFNQTSGCLGFTPATLTYAGFVPGAILAPVPEIISSGSVLWDHQYDF